MKGRFALLAVAILWVLGAASVLAGAWMDRAGRSSGPEATFAVYATAIEQSNLATALAQLVPEAREPSKSWMAWQMGNRYKVLESVVRGSSLLDRLAGRADDNAATLVVTMEIEGKGNPTWRAVEEVPSVYQSGRWLFMRPPLAGR